MAEEDKDSKTEDATEKRKEKAREDGQVAISQELGSLASLVAGLIIVAMLSPWMLESLKGILRDFVTQISTMPMDLVGLRQVLTSLLLDVGVILLPALGVILTLTVGITIVQVGFLWTPKKIQPKLSKVSPIAGVKKVISTQKLVDLLKALLKLLLIGVVIVVAIVPMYGHPDTYLQKDFAATLEDLRWIIVVLMFLVAVLFGFVALADLVWQQHQQSEKLKMTKQEVKEERKQSDGDPIIKGRIAKLRMQRHHDRMMASVPNASVVITNPTHYAIALLYDSDSMEAPKLVAKGIDHMAFRIREVAEENDVPIVENPPLARALYALVEIDQEVPPDHYKAVAEVIGYVMRLRTGSAGARAPSGG